MGKLIKVDFKTPQQLTGQEWVELRDVHAGVKSKRRFQDWVDYYMPNFEENQDFGLLHKTVTQKGSGGHNRKDYWITVDSAKQLAMMQNTEEGKKVRKYFLECEKLVHANKLEGGITNVPDIVSPGLLRQLATQLETLTNERDHALSVNTQLTDFAVDTVLLHGFTAILVPASFPKIGYYTDEYRKTQKPMKIDNFSGWVTNYLRKFYNLQAKSQTKGAASLYNKADLERIEKSLPPIPIGKVAV